MLDQHLGEGANSLDSHDYAKMPNVCFTFASRHHLSIADPAAVQDMLVTKNSLLDKSGMFERLFKNLLGNSFLFSKSDDVWKSKRKAIAHAFYKNRLIGMLAMFRDLIDRYQQDWLK